MFEIKEEPFLQKVPSWKGHEQRIIGQRILWQGLKGSMFAKNELAKEAKNKLVKSSDSLKSIKYQEFSILFSFLSLVCVCHGFNEYGYRRCVMLIFVDLWLNFLNA